MRLAKTALRGGDLPVARRWAEKGRDLLAGSNGAVAQAGAQLVLGEIALRSGDRAAGKRFLQQATDLYEQAGYVYGREQCRVLLQ
ncbi:MAG: hypothetical protein OHK0029_41210 [Armatimonadaceae bacterium]